MLGWFLISFLSAVIFFETSTENLQRNWLKKFAWFECIERNIYETHVIPIFVFVSQPEVDFHRSWRVCDVNCNVHNNCCHLFKEVGYNHDFF